MRTITTARLILRPWEPDDVDFLLDLEGRWDVVRYLGADPSTLDSRDDELASIGRRRRISDHPIPGIWIIIDTGGVRLGNLLLKPVPLSAGQEAGEPVEVEIGWHLHPGAWGHGYATEAAAAVIADALARGQRRIIAVTHPDNAASRAVCRRVGMRHLGRTTRYMDTDCELFEIKPATS